MTEIGSMLPAEQAKYLLTLYANGVHVLSVAVTNLVKANAAMAHVQNTVPSIDVMTVQDNVDQRILHWIKKDAVWSLLDCTRIQQSLIEELRRLS